MYMYTVGRTLYTHMYIYIHVYIYIYEMTYTRISCSSSCWISQWPRGWCERGLQESRPAWLQIFFIWLHFSCLCFVTGDQVLTSVPSHPMALVISPWASFSSPWNRKEIHNGQVVWCGLTWWLCILPNHFLLGSRSRLATSGVHGREAVAMSTLRCGHKLGSCAAPTPCCAWAGLPCWWGPVGTPPTVSLDPGPGSCAAPWQSPSHQSSASSQLEAWDWWESEMSSSAS